MPTPTARERALLDYEQATAVDYEPGAYTESVIEDEIELLDWNLMDVAYHVRYSLEVEKRELSRQDLDAIQLMVEWVESHSDWEWDEDANRWIWGD